MSTCKTKTEVMIDYLLFTFRPICGLLSDEVKKRPLVKSTLFMERWKAQGWGTGSVQCSWLGITV